ncbi:DUF3618 domain-containing protein [Arcanobacterium hippocoleae]
MNDKMQTFKAKEAEEIAKARLAAQMKRPADYDIDPEDNRSVSEVEADLARLRLELTATVDELASRLDPKVLSEEFKEKAKHRAANFGIKAKEFGDALINADPKALKKAGIALAGLLALVLLRKLGK